MLQILSSAICFLMIRIKVKITIIVPVYNVSEYLEQCLDSITNQTYRQLEIICINDGSTDSSLDILSKFALKDSRFIIIDQLNTGLSGARNAGLNKATGDYIMFVDSDDWLALDACDTAISAAVEKSVDIVMWPYLKEYGSYNKPQFIFDNDTLFAEGTNVKENLYRRLFGLLDNELNCIENLDSCVTATCKLYKTEILKNNSVTFIDTKRIGTEDALFNISVFEHVNRAFFLKKTLYHYRKTNENSLTSIKKDNLLDKWLYLFELMQSHITINQLNASFQDSLNNRVSLSFIGLSLNEMFSSEKMSTKFSNIVKIAKSRKHNDAIEKLNTKHMKPHWKLFFFLLKNGNYRSVFFFLICIKIVLRK